LHFRWLLWNLGYRLFLARLLLPMHVAGTGIFVLRKRYNLQDD
jgi:hypothetical protein